MVQTMFETLQTLCTPTGRSETTDLMSTKKFSTNSCIPVTSGETIPGEENKWKFGS